MSSNPTSHPMLTRLQASDNGHKVSRREFVRLACLLGVGTAAAYKLAGLPYAQAQDGGPFADDPNAKRGGVLRIAMGIQKMDDPALYSWNQMSNQARQMLEYLTFTDAKGVTHPMLLESWQPNEDLTQWTLHLRRNVLWHNGDTLNATDVAFNFKRWIEPSLGSTAAALPTMSAMVETKGDVTTPLPNAIEIVDDYTVRLNLSTPVLSVPEDLFGYQCCIVHRDFNGSIVDQPNGTGPFTIEKMVVGEVCRLKRVDQMQDGRPFKHWSGDIYLDGIEYRNYTIENQLLALIDQDVDKIYALPSEQLPLANSANVNITSVDSASTAVMRFRTSVKPFDNKTLRQAIQAAVDPSEFQEFVYGGRGAQGEHHHVAPVQPGYAPLPKKTRDVAKAKALLTKAGYPDGLEIEISLGNTDGPWEQTMAEVLRNQLKDIGIDLSINVLPTSKYWEEWDTFPFSLTVWVHRSLETTLLSLAYRSGAKWNETAFSNPEFDRILDLAQGEPNIEKRRVHIQKLEQILQDSGVIVQPLWQPILTAQSNAVRNYFEQPTRYHNFHKTWLDT